MIETLVAFILFVLFVILAIKLLIIRVKIQTAKSLDVIDELHQPFQMLWFRPNLFKDLQLITLGKIAKSDCGETHNFRTLDKKLEMFFKYKRSETVNHHKDIEQETIGLISKAVLAGIMECMAKNNFAETSESYDRVQISGNVYPPTEEMCNKIHNFFELTHHDLNSQNMYTEFKKRYGEYRQ